MKELLRIFKALSDPTRLRIVRLLARKELCVCELMYILDMPQSRVSHQLRLLRDADLVEDKRQGKWIIYAVSGSARKLLDSLMPGFSGAASDRSGAGDAKRLGLCLREDVRKTRGLKGSRRRR